MNHLFPPLLPKDDLRAPVLAIAAHPDDEVIACGGMLAWHAARGDQVTVVHLTDGAQGDPEGHHTDIAAVRRAEGRAALEILGVTDVRSYAYPDGQVYEHLEGVSATLWQVFEEIRPKTLYSFFFSEAHRDHRAVAAAVAGSAEALDPDCRCLLFGVNQVVMGGTLFEVNDFMDTKQRALAAFASQLEYNDWTEKILHRDHAATVNVEDPAIQYAELFADLSPSELPRVRQLVESSYRYLLRDEG